MSRWRSMGGGKWVEVTLRLLLWSTGIVISSRAGHTEDVIPHNQTAAPGPALSPQEAIARMEVPPGFHVELVAAEPDVVNPVAMTIDERGRYWVTESFEYPRQEAGVGRDRIKVLEDTDDDGQVDKVTVFAEGLNIPSGIAVGHGGVWVANSPDILFLRDTDGDDRADQSEVVVTGFGRTDTHELPNSLVWGPDGWLYGLNGVFNHSDVHYRGKEWKFTCAVFRIHPRTREFELFAEGTSNPWGIAFDREGQLFVSACVIDHLWHLTETGYYHRQGGPYPPHTWKIDSIVDYKHQMAAYCGITYFDSEAYPVEFREKLYMGNIHGGCINSDRLERQGATYAGKLEPDFLTAHDAWFMPVVQKTGPDGCLLILDWYDRYHCYQDANRDPAGIDRGKGRLYRVRYGEAPRQKAPRLANASEQELIAALGHANIYVRETAQRLIAERNTATLREGVWRLVQNSATPGKQRVHALWARISCQSLTDEELLVLVRDPDATIRAWGVRAAVHAARERKVGETVRRQIGALARDTSPAVVLEVVIAARALGGADQVTWLNEALQTAGDDRLIPHIVWQNLLPIWDEQADAWLAAVATHAAPSAAQGRLMSRALVRALDAPQPMKRVGELLKIVLQQPHWPCRQECLGLLRDHWLAYGVTEERQSAWQEALQPAWQAIARNQPEEVRAASVLAGLVGDRDALERLRTWAGDPQADLTTRFAALEVLAARQDPLVLPVMTKLWQGQLSDEQQTRSLDILGRLTNPQVAEQLLQIHTSLSESLRPRVIELLTQRSAWSTVLVQAVESQRLPKEALHVNQVRRLQHANDGPLREAVARVWGVVREERNPQVEQAIAQVDALFAREGGDPQRGAAVFQKTCAQCHQIYGQGQQVGPDITRNGRSSYEQLLSNVFDPNLVIGSGYQSHSVITTDGRTLSGLLVEKSDQQIVLKLQGGKVETIPREQVEEFIASPLSLMPEGWEKQLSPQELGDLLAYITLDGPPQDPASRPIRGTPVR